MARRRARLVSEIVTWQLADHLQMEVLKLTVRPRFVGEVKLRSRTEEAAISVCRSIGEGFNCQSNSEFARCLKLSARSLSELTDALRAAQLKQYVTVSDLTAIDALTTHLDAALGDFLGVTDRGAIRSRRADVRRRASPTSP